MAADAVNFRLNQLHPELTFRHQENFVLHKKHQKAASVPHNNKNNPQFAAFLGTGPQVT